MNVDLERHSHLKLNISYPLHKCRTLVKAIEVMLLLPRPDWCLVGGWYAKRTLSHNPSFSLNRSASGRALRSRLIHTRRNDIPSAA